VAKPPSMSGYNLTTKVEGKTVTLYVRKDIVVNQHGKLTPYQRLILTPQN